MTATKSVERMHSLFHEMKLHYLTEPNPGVNSDQDFTLSWPLRTAQVSIIFGEGILLTLTEPEKETVTLNLTGHTDSRIIDIIIQWGLIESREPKKKCSLTA
jgi:hypothetical protein